MMRPTIAFTTLSTTQKYAARRKVAAITTSVVACTCFQFGQETGFISPSSSSMYDLVCWGQPPALVISIQDLLDCPPVLVLTGAQPLRAWVLAGAEGFEPPLAVLETAGLPLNLCPSDRV